MWIVSSSSCLFFLIFFSRFLVLVSVFHVRGSPPTNSWAGFASIMENLIGKSVDMNGACWLGFSDWGRPGYLWGTNCEVFFFSLSQSVFLPRTPWISCGREFEGNNVESSIQKPSLERAGSFTLGCADVYLPLVCGRASHSVLSYDWCSWVQPFQKVFCCVEKRQLPDPLVEEKESESLTALLKDFLFAPHHRPPFLKVNSYFLQMSLETSLLELLPSAFPRPSGMNWLTCFSLGALTGGTWQKEEIYS